MTETDRELRALQEVELDLLHRFDEICRRENLRYFLLGGSHWGAVRHGGFIPWDDDIDVGMPVRITSAFCGLRRRCCLPTSFCRTTTANRPIC